MPTLHPLFGDHAIIASHRPRIHGKADPGETVTVSLGSWESKTVADPNGRWSATFPSLPAGGPYLLTAKDRGGEVTSSDVWIGDVWLGSGQSNMEWSLALIKETEADRAQAPLPLLRFFTVPRVSIPFGPQKTLSGKWEVVTPQTVGEMSAVAFYFGRELVKATQRPIGMVVSAWGGSPIACWLPEETLQKRPEYASFLAELEAGRTKDFDPDADKPHKDVGISAEASTWMNPDVDDQNWDVLTVPGLWQNQGWNFNGTVWYRKTVEIPSSWVGCDLWLDLGAIDDFDQTWVNGILVGATGMETPSWWAFPRRYRVPREAITGTRVVIAVRVFDQWGNGGMLGNPTLAPMAESGTAPLVLQGIWRARVEKKLPLRAPMGQIWPSSLWNGMIAPLQGVSFTGVIWYQGEADTERAILYRRLLNDLIVAWRSFFEEPEMPFGIVQLANYMERKDVPTESGWAELREAQRRVALTLPGCGLATAIDLGEAEDIHPRRKREVGDRLALWALHCVHGRKDLPYAGPLYAEHWREKNGIRIRFTHAEGLQVRGKELRGFQIAGMDRRWVWAEAEIQGDTVFVSSPAVSTPVAVRYAWQANPEITLENAWGLPASSFRTDDWPDLG